VEGLESRLNLGRIQEAQQGLLADMDLVAQALGSLVKN